MRVSVGATDANTGRRFESRRSLMIAVRTTPGTVMFDKTDPRDQSGLPYRFTAVQVPVGVKLSIVGPDPYTRRHWFARAYVQQDYLVVR